MKKFLIITLGVILLVGAYLAYDFYRNLFVSNVSTEEDFVLYIPTGAGFQSVLDSLEKHNILRNRQSFVWTAEKKNYPTQVKPGRYLIEDGWNNHRLINKLRGGRQDAVKLVLHDVSGVYELAGKLSRKLEGDSVDFLNYLKDEAELKNYDLKPQTVTAYFLPNTYEFYWNSSPKSVLLRMQGEYEKFWNDERRAKAAEMGLSTIEVITLASIVEKETVKKDEQAQVAGLYFNRIKKGMKLQSDPTVIYGINIDYPERRITRVYYSDLAYDSPFNTYMYPGLPPGPIKIPALYTIDAVLNHEKHDYIFMVADPARPGYHSFAVDYSGHLRNERVYKRSLK